MLINFNHDTKHMDHVAFGQQSFSFFFFFFREMDVGGQEPQSSDGKQVRC